ncbi:hypothetical protein B7C51_10255 [Paenibacillus larvae subsp. pulvifaciens]|uniref:Uncharacterized protein n=1 Tax=Paenibacillus larvae subsp. pulvifaciens TaxID=1477 RepID=A0A1V0USM1_9BACL|nr:hypothetical protein B7C51_10255 [Paenibacillus larvae subsp. pulvifaciens]
MVPDFLFFVFIKYHDKPNKINEIGSTLFYHLTKICSFKIKLRSFAPFRYDYLKGYFFISKRKRTSELKNGLNKAEE